MMIAVITSCLLIAGGTHPSPEVNFSALQAHLSKLRSSARKTAKQVKQNMLKVGGPDSWGNSWGLQYGLSCFMDVYRRFLKFGPSKFEILVVTQDLC